MRVDTALLCGAATARDGLLSILDGGITEVHNAQYPAPLGLTLAMRIMVHPTEVPHEHKVEILLQDEDGQEVTKVEIGLPAATDAAIPAGEEAALPIPWNFPGRPILPHMGRYSFEILIDGVHQLSIPLNANEATQGGEQAHGG
jgi:hypothetical protein